MSSKFISSCKTLFLSITIIGFIVGCADRPAGQEEGSIKVHLNNPGDAPSEKVFASMAVDKDVIKAHELSPGDRWKSDYGQAEWFDSDDDGQVDGLAFYLDNVESGESELEFTWDTTHSNPENQKTYAEIAPKTGGQWGEKVYEGGEFTNVSFLRLPDEHTDHTEFIRYEGPGWESELVAYRLYLDWRNAIDVFGKKEYNTVLSKVGLDGFESYHHMQDWGMDIMKVGESLGIGSFGTWENGRAVRVEETDSVHCKIENGHLQSSVGIKYFGWKQNDTQCALEADLSIHAGSRMTHVNLRTDKPVKALCTGIAKHPDAEFFSAEGTGDWAYIATWGKQTLVPDRMGLAVLYPKSEFLESTQDSLNYIIVLDGSDRKTKYAFLAVWEKEPQAWTSREQFEEYLNSALYNLDNPVKVSIKKEVE